MNLLGKGTPLQVLTGTIRSLNSISVDRSLTVDGDSADAKAAGDGIREAKALALEHAQRTDNPHGVTRTQLGLGNLDNTADMDKPVSGPQAAAIAAAKQEALAAAKKAQAAADAAPTAADQAQTTADTAQGAADTAQAAAESARTAADKAQETADSKTAWFTASASLEKDGWRGTEQTLSVPGVTEDLRQPLFVTPAEDSREDYVDCGIRVVGQGSDSLTFSCTEVPERAVTLHIVGFTLPKEAAL